MKSHYTVIALGCLLGALGTSGCSNKDAQKPGPPVSSPVNPATETPAQMAAKVQNPYLRQQFMNGAKQ